MSHQEIIWNNKIHFTYICKRLNPADISDTTAQISKIFDEKKYVIGKHILM